MNTPEVSLEFATVRTYWFTGEAAVALATLTGMGIPAYLENENTVRMVWAWNNCLGGIRLVVQHADVLVADEILSQDSTEEPVGGRPWWALPVLLSALFWSPAVSAMQMFSL